MKISTEIGSIARRVGYEKAIEYCSKAGFDAFDFSMADMASYDGKNDRVIVNKSTLGGDDYIKFVRKLKKVADDNGIICNQSHAPHPIFIPEIRSFLYRAIECTAEIGGEICIIHPNNYKPAEENAEMYFELLPYAKEHNVKIAAENMWVWDYELEQALPGACSCHQDFLKHMQVVNDEYLVACVDVGHAELKGLDTSAVQMIETLGGHLQALHIHDNDLRHDYHKLPGSMQIDYMPILKALKRVKYNGYFTLEAYNHLSGYETDNIFRGVKEMADTARKFANLFDEL